MATYTAKWGGSTFWGQEGFKVTGISWCLWQGGAGCQVTVTGSACNRDALQYKPGVQAQRGQIVQVRAYSSRSLTFHCLPAAVPALTSSHMEGEVMPSFLPICCPQPRTSIRTRCSVSSNLLWLERSYADLVLLLSGSFALHLAVFS